MRLYEFSEHTFLDYLDRLEVGDKAIVKKRGHEFVKMKVTAVNEKAGLVRCSPHAFCRETGVSEKSGYRIMLPTETTLKQLNGCEVRKSKVDRIMKAIDPGKMVKYPMEDLDDLLDIVEG